MRQSRSRYRRLDVEFGTVLERRGHERIALTGHLSLGQGPELDGLHPPHQSVRKVGEREDPGRAGEQETPGPGIAVDRRLDHQQQLGSWHRVSTRPRDRPACSCRPDVRR